MTFIPTQARTQHLPGSQRLAESGAHRQNASQRSGGPEAKWNVSYNPSATPGRLAGSPTKVVYEAMKAEFKANNHGQKMPFAMKRALLPTPDATIDRGSVDRMLRAAQGDSDLHLHSLNPERNSLVSDKGLVSKESFGSGQHNSTYKCQFRGKDVDGVRSDALTETRVVKMSGELKLTNGGTASIVGFVGIDADKPRIPDRNIATSRVNGFLGTNSVPQSSAGMVEGRSCVAMTLVPGETAKNYYATNPEIVRDPDFQRQMSDVEVNAFLCGNPDPNPTNLMIGHGPDGKVAVTMIDNDMAFGAKMTNPDQPPEYDTGGRSYHHTGLPAFMSTATCEAVKAMDIDACAHELSTNLKPDEVAAFKDRANLLKEHVSFLESNDRVVADWAEWKTEGGKTAAGGDFFTGTMQMAGVKQGEGTPGAPVVTPRSLICRDMLMYNGARNFDHLPEKSSLMFPANVIVPPGGIDPLAGLAEVGPSPQPRIGATAPDGGVRASDLGAGPRDPSVPGEQVASDDFYQFAGREPEEDLYQNRAASQPAQAQPTSDDFYQFAGAEPKEDLYQNGAASQPAQAQPASDDFYQMAETEQRESPSQGAAASRPAEGRPASDDFYQLAEEERPEDLYQNGPENGRTDAAVRGSAAADARNAGSNSVGPGRRPFVIGGHRGGNA